MVQADLVPSQKMTDITTTIWCAHGSVVVYPIAKDEDENWRPTIHIEAAVSKSLPVSVLGTEVPELFSLLY